MFHNRKIHLAIVLSVLACYVLLVETCAPKIAEIYYKFMRKEKPCTDTRRKTIRVGRNPVRTVVVHDFGAHEECSKNDECLPKIKCKDGCCL